MYLDREKQEPVGALLLGKHLAPQRSLDQPARNHDDGEDAEAYHEANLRGW